MTNVMTSGLAPTHPGEVLREIVIPATGHRPAAIARLLGISRQQLHDILNEKKPVTTPMALRLAKLFDTTPESWLRMQQAFDLRAEAVKLEASLADIPVLKAA